MKDQNLTISFLVDKTPAQVFQSINNVCDWWTDNLKGNTLKLNDEFEVQFWDLHYSKQKLIEFIPDKKVVWLVTDSNLTFLKDKSEWTGTKIIFEISEVNGKTQLNFVHEGLIPPIECYGACSGAWSEYIQGSLQDLIVKGIGKPTKKDS